MESWIPEGRSGHQAILEMSVQIFPAPSFAGTAVEDSIQSLMPKLRGWDLVLDTSRLYHVIKKPCVCLQGSSSMLWNPAQAHLFKAKELCYLKAGWLMH